MATTNTSSPDSLQQKRPKHILKLNKEEKLAFLNSFDHVFSDIDGVVWNMEITVPGAPAAFDELKKAGKKCVFITNNSVRPLEVCARRFKTIGMQVEPQDIWHPAQSICDYLKSIKFEGLIYVIATEAFKKVLRDAGFQLIDGPTKILEESLAVLGQHIFDGEPVRAVVIDADINLNSTKILRAHIYLRHPECLLIAGATDFWLPIRPDFNIIGPGRFSKILIEASKKEAITLGKPGKQLGEMLKQHYGIKQPQRTLMIGDMLEQDISFGRLCGFKTLLVLSGACKPHDLENETLPELIPDYYADSVNDINELMRSLYKSNV